MIGMIVFKRKHVSSFDTMQFIKFCKQENINGIINCIQTRKKSKQENDVMASDFFPQLESDEDIYRVRE